MLLLSGLASVACAQKPVYFDYPQVAPKQEPLTWREMPSWMTIDWEFRSRTEGQTSYNEVSANDRIYDLTRVRFFIDFGTT